MGNQDGKSPTMTSQDGLDKLPESGVVSRVTHIMNKVGETNNIYQEGHKAGYDVGHTRGYQAGFGAGYREGHAKGYTEGYAKALERLGKEWSNLVLDHVGQKEVKKDETNDK